jgi:hypothetical protein
VPQDMMVMDNSNIPNSTAFLILALEPFFICSTFLPAIPSHPYYCRVIQISYKMIVTPAQAGVQFRDVWIPACAGMTV